MSWLKMSTLNEIILDNNLMQWASALAITLGIFVLLKLVQNIGIKKIRKLFTRYHIAWMELVLDSLQKTHSLVLFIVAVYAGSRSLSLSEDANHILYAVCLVSVFIQIGLWASGFINGWATNYREAQIKTNPSAVTTVGALRMVILPLLWVCIALLILDNLGVNITTLVAGLGIGGVAVALAAQNILGDLFASLSIVMDKTFLVGDYIRVDQYEGTVEYIGMKNTRIRSLSGEQIVFSNTDLLGGRIRNYGRMFERRILVRFKLAHTIKQEQIELIPALIREAVEKQEKTRFDRAHFSIFDSAGLEFEYVYHVTSSEYNLYMNINQGINMFLREQFSKHKIEFASVTPSVQVQVTKGLDGKPMAEAA